jgi:hypothetical protein
MMNAEEVKTELLTLSCELAAHDGGNEADWKAKNPEKGKRWEDLGNAAVKLTDTLPTGEREKYTLEIIEGALGCQAAA